MPSRRARVRSFAKVNLELRVLHKRPDGFHELRTIFQTVSLADTIDIEFERGRTRIELDSTVDIPDNLLIRAAHLTLEAMKTTGQVRFRLTKKIPMGGGLGGGSSNAAAVLLALPALAGTRIGVERLLELAASLGSDVPFFLLGGTAVGLGRGVELYPLPDGPAQSALLVTPGLHVSTAEAYRALNRETATSPPASDVNQFQSLAWSWGEVVAGKALLTPINHFETVVFRQHPQLKSILGRLRKLGARTALMSGSGSSLFGIFDSRESRGRAAVSIEREFGKDSAHAVSLLSRRRYRAIWWRQLAEHIDSRVWPPQSRYA